MLDGDWCWAMNPFVVNDETRSMVMDNIVHVLSNFLRCSEFDHILFCWVMHDQQIIDDLLTRLPLDGVSVLTISLVCSPEVLKSRIQRDIDAGIRQSDVLQRSLARLPLYENLRTQKLDTSLLSIKETAQKIISIVKQE